MTDELRMRAVTSREIGIESPEREAVAETGRRRPHPDRRRSRGLATSASPACWPASTRSTSRPIRSEALFHAAEGNYDLLIVSLGLENFDGLRLCSQVRSLDRTRNVPILAIAEAEDNARLVRGLEIGVNDYLVRPIDKNELLARVRTQIRKKRYTERLRDNVQHVDRDGDHRRAHRPLQSPLHGKPSRHAGRAGRRARQAAHGAGARHRLFQVDQRHLRPRCRRRRAARIRHPHHASRSAASISPAATAARNSSS